MSEGMIILIAIVLFSILIPLAFWRLKYLRKQGVAKMQQKLSGERIIIMDDKAIFYGQKSRGFLHSRELGGVFALTEEAAYFKTFHYGKYSDFEIKIPRQHFRGVKIASNFLAMGQNIIGDLLVLEFVNEQNENDEIAWRFADNDETMQRLQQLAKIKAV